MRKRYALIIPLAAISVLQAWSSARRLVAARKTEQQRRKKRACDQRRYKYFEGVYYQEEKRRDTLWNSLTFALATVGVLGGLLSYYVQDILDWLPNQPFRRHVLQFWTSSYLALVTTAAICWLMAIVFFIRSFFNYTYRYVATPLQLLAYHNQLTQHYGDVETTEDQFQEYLTTEYAESADQTDRNNVTKRKNLHQCVFFCIISLACLFLTFPPFLVHRTEFPKEPLKISVHDAHVTLDGNNTRLLYPAIRLDHLSPLTEGIISPGQHEKTETGPIQPPSTPERR